MTMLARIKPHNPKYGLVLKRLTIRGKLFDEATGWYEVDDRMAAYLKTVHARPDAPEDPTNPLAFDVCTRAQAEEMHATEFEKKIQMGRVGPRDAPKIAIRGQNGQTPHPILDASPGQPAGGMLTTDDLKEGTSRARSKGRSSSAPAASKG